MQPDAERFFPHSADTVENLRQNAAQNLRTVYGHIPDRTTKEKGNIWTFGKDSLPELEEENQSRLQKRNAQRSGIQSWQANSRRQSGSS